MTRDKILKLMNVTEEEFRIQGASVEDMMPVFEEFKLTVRLYNCIGQTIFSFDPERKNQNIPALYGLIKGNHIYTMNDNIMNISHRDTEEDMRLSASSDFQLNSKEKPVKYDFCNGIEDIMEIIKKNENEEKDKRGKFSQSQEFKIHLLSIQKAKYKSKIIMGIIGNISSIKFNYLILNIRN